MNSRLVFIGPSFFDSDRRYYPALRLHVFLLDWYPLVAKWLLEKTTKERRPVDRTTLFSGGDGVVVANGIVKDKDTGWSRRVPNRSDLDRQPCGIGYLDYTTFWLVCHP